MKLRSEELSILVAIRMWLHLDSRFVYFWLCWVFSTCGEQRLFSNWGAWTSCGSGFSHCRAQALVVMVHGLIWGFSGGANGKESACQCRSHGFNPWVRKITWRRKWQPTSVFLPGESHGQRSLAGCSPCGHRELATAEHSTAWAYLTCSMWDLPGPGIELVSPGL